MTRLTVLVSGAWSESRVLTLPVDVYSPDGTVLARGIASPTMPAHFELRTSNGHELERVYVLGTLPNGAILQQRVELIGEQAQATLRLGDDSPHEWLEWVTQFRSLGHLHARSQSEAVAPRRIGKVWMTLWLLEEGRWEAKKVEALAQQRDVGMQQIVLEVPNKPHLLQIGGEEVAWRLVSLPPGGPVRIALTRRADEGGDALEITIGRSQPDNELIMSYLARGAVSEADRLAEAWHVADLMLHDKHDDPVSAAAGAYLLLKNRRLERRTRWVDNLVNLFPFMSDGAIVSAALAAQRDGVTASEIRSKIDLALARGFPIFSMGISLLVETMAAVHRGKKESKRFHMAYLAAQAYARAQCSKGAYFAFYGKSPAEPAWTQIYGVEGQALANRASAEFTQAVVYARPLGGVQAGKFGRTRVALPRAPVSAQVVKNLRVEELLVDGSNVPSAEASLEQYFPPDKLFRLTRELGVQLIETNFLREFSAGSERTPVKAAPKAAAPAPREVISSGSVKKIRRQTAKYWRDERSTHAISVFAGDE